MNVYTKNMNNGNKLFNIHRTIWLACIVINKRLRRAIFSRRRERNKIERFATKMIRSKKRQTMVIDLKDIYVLILELECVLFGHCIFRDQVGSYKATFEGLTLTCPQCGKLDDSVKKNLFDGPAITNANEYYHPRMSPQPGLVERPHYCCSGCYGKKVYVTYDPQVISRWTKPLCIRE